MSSSEQDKAQSRQGRYTFHFQDTFEQKVQKLLSKYNVPGLAISVVRREDDKWVEGVKAWGIRNAEGSSWEPDSLHAIASCSKAFAAASVGILIARRTKLSNGEILNWNTKIKDVLPDWKLMDKVTEENADIEDVLTMRLGIPGNNTAWGGEEETAESVVHRMRYNKLAAPLRKVVIYSNENYILAGEFIAKLAGVPYHDFVKQNILDPLGMSETTFDANNNLTSGERRVEGFIHYDQDDKKCAEAMAKGDWTEDCAGKIGQGEFWRGNGLFLSAPGGIWTTADDMLLWLKECLDPKVLSKEIVAEISRPRACWSGTAPGHPSVSMLHYGLGQYTSYYKGHRIVGHAGGFPRHHSLVLRLPDNDIGFAIFNNDDTFGTDINNIISMSLIDELLGIPDEIDWEEVYLGRYLREVPVYDQPPAEARPSPDVSGSYHNPTYRKLTVRQIENDPLGPVYSSLLNEYPGNSIPRRSDAPVYLGERDHSLRGRILLAPFNGPIFTWAFFKAEKIQPVVERETRFVGQLAAMGKCVVTEKGIGMFEDFWGQGGASQGTKVRKCVEEDVEDNAEVWFKRTGGS